MILQQHQLPIDNNCWVKLSWTPSDLKGMIVVVVTDTEIMHRQIMWLFRQWLSIRNFGCWWCVKAGMVALATEDRACGFTSLTTTRSPQVQAFHERDWCEQTIWLKSLFWSIRSVACYLQPFRVNAKFLFWAILWLRSDSRNAARLVVQGVTFMISLIPMHQAYIEFHSVSLRIKEDIYPSH